MKFAGQYPFLLEYMRHWNDFIHILNCVLKFRTGEEMENDPDANEKTNQQMQLQEINECSLAAFIL